MELLPQSRAMVRRKLYREMAVRLRMRVRKSSTGVAVDAFGNLYIADLSNNRIRKVDTNGVISTVAGNGSGTYAGDGGAGYQR